MKSAKILMACLLFVGILSAQVQNDQAFTYDTETPSNIVTPEPSYDNSAVYYDVQNNRTVNLESIRAETKYKGNGLSLLPIGVSGGKSKLVLKGGASPVVVPRNANFLIKLANDGVDPNSWVMLYRLQAKQKKNPYKSMRTMTVSKSSGFGVSFFGSYDSKSVSGESQLIPIFQQVRPGVYLLSLASPLLEGEYFFSIIDPNAEQSQSPMVYAFGVR